MSPAYPTLLVALVIAFSLSFAAFMLQRARAREAEEAIDEIERELARSKQLSLPTPYWHDGCGKCSDPYPFSRRSDPDIESYEAYYARVLAKATLVARREYAEAQSKYRGPNWI